MNEKEDGEEEEERPETDDEEWRPPAEVQTVQISLFQINITQCDPISKPLFLESSSSWSKFLSC